MKVNVDLNEYLKAKIAHCTWQINAYPEKLNMEKDSCHGSWTQGYLEGKLAALEDIYDLVRMETK